MEKLEEVDKLKSRFFANITHELRTPLTLILGPIEALLSKKQNYEITEQLGFVQRNARKLLRSIDLLLKFSRLESGTMKLTVAKHDGVELLRRITGYFASVAAQKQIALQFKAQEGTISGLIDTEKIDHILQNLLSNAIKFSAAGATIDVTAWSESGHLCFSVRDTGIGISQEELPHLFERFYRVDQTHKTEGTGIGLSLSKEFAELHHGTIDVNSELGKGTIVTVRIPLSGYAQVEIVDTGIVETNIPEQSTSTDQCPPGDERPAPVDNDRPMILLVEDNDDARKFITSQLSNHYQVIETVDGLEAITTTQYQIPDLVISDVMMPKKDGYEVCRAIKHDERTCHIPVILLTALAEQENKLSGLDIGADDYITKPFDMQELITRVRNLIANRKKIREAFTRTTELRPGMVSVSSLDNTFLQKAIAVVDQHIARPDFGVEKFAQGMFLSRRQLHRKLTAITNLSATDFIRHLRLQRAKDLLSQNAGTVAEIAEMVGFTNHSYFAKCFREQFGILPNEARHHQE